MLSNAVAVPVVEWIGRRIIEADGMILHPYQQAAADAEYEVRDVTYSVHTKRGAGDDAPASTRR